MSDGCHTVPVLRARVLKFFCGPVRRKIWPVRQTPHVIRALLNTCFYNYELSYDLFVRSCLIDQLASIYTTIALVKLMFRYRFFLFFNVPLLSRTSKTNERINIIFNFSKQTEKKLLLNLVTHSLLQSNLNWHTRNKTIEKHFAKFSNAYSLHHIKF
jgi:hypothetical protein